MPAVLFAGVDLSGWLQPAPPPSIVVAEPGDSLRLQLEGTLEDGSQFEPNQTVNATLGSADLVTGLANELVGLAAGEGFNLTIAPEEAYGLWNQSRTADIAWFEDVPRNFTMATTSFHSQFGSPYVGENITLLPWNAHVTAVGATAVGLAYDPALGEAVRYYRYWDSAATSVNESRVELQNLLGVGDSFTLQTRAGQPVTWRVTALDNGSFLLDSNPPLAGHALHFSGTILAIIPGTGARTGGGTAVALGPDRCERCHVGAGFSAVDASAQAQQSPAGIQVNLTVDNPWLHEDEAVRVEVQASGTSGANATGGMALGSLGTSQQRSLTVALTNTSADRAVTVKIDAVAHHIHASGGKPDDLAYELTFKVPVGGQGRTQAAPAKAALGEGWALAGRVVGYLALAGAAFPAAQGLRRHWGKAPLFKWPPWLTTHFSLSLAVIVLTAVHAVALMSTAYRGDWSWGIVVGVLALVALGVMGVTGVILAKWTAMRLSRVRTIHFWLMIAMLAAGILHTLVTGTAVHQLLGF